MLALTWHFREINNAAPKDLESRGFPDTDTQLILLYIRPMKAQMRE